jgi:hypothetical protein
MDPDEALRQIVIGTDEVRAALDGNGDLPRAAERLADHAEALDGWLRGGGLLPKDWAAYTTAATVAKLLTAGEAVLDATEGMAWPPSSPLPAAIRGLQTVVSEVQA